MPFNNCHLCSHTCSVLDRILLKVPSNPALYCQYCRDIVEQFACLLADDEITSKYARGFLTTPDDPKGVPCTICGYKEKCLKNQLWPVAFLCFACRTIKAHGLSNYVREDQRCMAQTEYEGDGDVPDSWGVHHNSQNCETCAYYKAKKKKPLPTF